MSAIHHSGEKYDRINARRISLRAPPAPNPVNTFFLNLCQSHPPLPCITAPRPDNPTRTRRRLAPEHRDVGDLPPPKRIACGNGNAPAQPIWELRLNPDYGTIPGVPLLEALHGVGVVGAASAHLLWSHRKT
jgi:hypothetical protein